MDPQRFGDYVLLERIAVGGMAEVFRARLAREGGVQRQVCIKRVHPKHSADASFSAMFIDEARISVTLSHGNIVPVFDFGCVDGLYYLAMEYVEGRDLAQIAARARIAHKPWPVPIARSCPPACPADATFSPCNSVNAFIRGLHPARATRK